MWQCLFTKATFKVSSHCWLIIWDRTRIILTAQIKSHSNGKQTTSITCSLNLNIHNLYCEWIIRALQNCATLLFDGCIWLHVQAVVKLYQRCTPWQLVWNACSMEPSNMNYLNRFRSPLMLFNQMAGILQAICWHTYKYIYIYANWCNQMYNPAAHMCTR